VAEAIVALRDLLRDAELSLDGPGVEEARELRDGLVGQIDDYLLPRLRQIEAPLLAVVGGSTGAGKSTLVNTLVRREVSPAGVLRPTTRGPVLVCHPQDLEWFSDDRILPGLSRTTGAASAGPRSLHVRTDEGIPSGLALLDAPDIDSVVTENRELAVQLMAAADLWLFITTAARYADAVPWDLLRTARDRSTAIAMVLNRVPEEAARDVPEDLRGLMQAEGLAAAPLFVVPESALEDGLIPSAAVAPVREWLDRLAADAEARSNVIRTTLGGALDSVPRRVEEVALAVDAQVAATKALRAEVERGYDRAREEIQDALQDGSLLRGEVLARWHEFIGTGEFMRNLETRIGQLRDRVREMFTGRPGGGEVRAALESSIETLVVAGAERAAERVAEAWAGTPPGRNLLPDDRHREMARPSPDIRERTDAEVRAWQGHVLELVSAEGASKRTTGRVLSLSVNTLGVAVMVAVFAHTGGLTGGELVVAGGTATLSQKLLEALFGDQAVRELTLEARSDLARRIDGLLGDEAERFERLLRPVEPEPDRGGRLRAAARAVQAARS
jgi:hypothetical protein